MSDAAHQAPAESSTATAVLEVPTDSKEYGEWRVTGKLPERKAAPPAKSEPKPEAPAASTSEKAAPASEAGNRQERKRSNAETRLNELLDDLKRAGLSPAELKTFQREAKQVQPQAATTETTAKPAGPPPKPKLEDYKTIDGYESARDAYYENLADYKARQRLAEFQQQQKQAEAAKALNEKVQSARQRYGAEADTHIQSAAQAIFSDKDIPVAVKALTDQSPVLVDLMYVIGSKPEDLAELVSLAKSDPGAAIRKIVLLESLVKEELAKARKPEASESGGAQRDASGKFVSDAPEKKTSSKAPEPPKEVSGRGATPPDEIDSAVKSSDFATFRAAANRRDLERRRGR